MKAEEQIIEALDHAKQSGVRITRRAVFNWCEECKGEFNRKQYKVSETPTECCALGAILILHNKEHLAGPGGFNKLWLIEISKILNKDMLWLWKFVNGWSYGNELVIETKDGESKDSVSRWANKLSKKYVLK